MEKIRNLSLKKTIFLYLTLGLVVGFFLSALIAYLAEEVQIQIWCRYTDLDAYYEAQRQAPEYLWQISRPPREEMSAFDWNVSELCDFLETYSVLLCSLGASGAAVGLFYRNKLKVPLKELHRASQMIAQGELEFQVTYENGDEMGRLCREFERMRAQLEENNRKVWRMVEDEKALRAAIAHDIRSPLSVLKGYQEMLLEFLPAGLLDAERSEEMLRAGMKQIERLDNFIETMRNMTRLEERKIVCAPVDPAELRGEIEREAEALCREAGKDCAVRLAGWAPGGDGAALADAEVILETADNLIQNAARYARQQVTVTVSCKGFWIFVEVLDDGEGFSETADEVTQAYHRGDSRDSLQHFGMGMYISRIYCERHGGRLAIENRREGGAAVTAAFGTRLS